MYWRVNTRKVKRSREAPSPPNPLARATPPAPIGPRAAVLGHILRMDVFSLLTAMQVTRRNKFKIEYLWIHAHLINYTEICEASFCRSVREVRI